ncbi:hypothetical protein HG536_0A05330 [Torulaspora globosa]|uniref:EXS domain-containing protein n=1 Tax=Torulaspora globosa TaxID=48254 RepID=A0A7G3ZB32_9SACH|nr:uncharacterized protein HG536_0A05330 [Torulaspora globosa]QLL30718.1 hypothetical protein HG536_0A05330 [Torulaspora globosa]
MEGAEIPPDVKSGWGIYILASQRVNVLLLVAIWLWQWMLKLLSSCQLDVSTVIQSRKPNEMVLPLSHAQMQRLSRQFAVRLSRIIVPLQLIGLLCQSWAEATERSSNLAQFAILLLPLIQFVIIVGSISRNCQIINYCIKRILLIETSPRPMRNVYILLSDTLTSFTKPLIDFTLYLTTLFLSKDVLWTHCDLLISLFPLNIRIWQCFREFYLGRDKSLLVNALKYISSIPIMVCVWHSRVDPEKHNSNVVHWFQCLNSCFTLVWDVRMDWKINSLRRIRKNHKTSQNVIFPKFVYYMGVLFDFSIKFWWIWTLKRPDHTILFASELQYLEILRRSVWVIFKLESEYVTIRNLATEK